MNINQSKIAIIGLGYVGLPLARLFATKYAEVEFEKARVRWFLSIDENDLPNNIKAKGQRTFRSITINETEIEFSDGFTELHTESYKNILEGNGFGLVDAKPSVEITHTIRNSEIITNSNLKHKSLP